MQRPDTQRRLFDSILKRGLGTRRNSEANGCPDETTLAAYCDRSLPLSQAAGWEEHFSNCARCQGTLAAIARARTALDSPTVSRMVGRRWELYAALAAAVAGISIAVGLMRNGGNPSVTTPNYVLKELPASTRPRNQAQSKAPEAGAQIALNENVTREARATSEPRIAQTPPPPIANECCAPRLARSVSPNQPARVRHEGGLGLSARSAPSQTAARTGSRAALATGSAGIAPKMSERELAVPSAPGAGPPARSAAAGAFVPAPAAAPLAGSAMPEMISVRTADNVERWRLGSNGAIQHRELDGSWQEQSSGVSSALRAGAAPSPITCWIVGTGGTVLRTIDGEHWQRIDSPTSEDLVAVFATDASDATVTAADGRRFTTADAGHTWHSL